MDLTAGEKERGTMETILSSPVSRTHLVIGKFLLVLTTSLSTAALSVISMGVSFTIANHFQPPANSADSGASFHIGFMAALSVFIMALPLAVLFASALITISAFAKSYKEAQSYIMPLMFIVIIPAIAAMLPGVELDAKLALVPILSVSLLCKELVTGTYHWDFIAIIFVHLRLRRHRSVARRQNVPAQSRPLPLLTILLSPPVSISGRSTISRILGSRRNIVPFFDSDFSATIFRVPMDRCVKSVYS